MAAVADLGAVLRPASKCERLVRGVAIVPSLSAAGLMAPMDKGLIPCPPLRDARPELGMARLPEALKLDV